MAAILNTSYQNSDSVNHEYLFAEQSSKFHLDPIRNDREEVATSMTSAKLRSHTYTYILSS